VKIIKSIGILYGLSTYFWLEFLTHCLVWKKLYGSEIKIFIIILLFRKRSWSFFVVLPWVRLPCGGQVDNLASGEDSGRCTTKKLPSMPKLTQFMACVTHLHIKIEDKFQFWLTQTLFELVSKWMPWSFSNWIKSFTRNYQQLNPFLGTLIIHTLKFVQRPKCILVKRIYQIPRSWILLN